jgi:hypothetical protein
MTGGLIGHFRKNFNSLAASLPRSIRNSGIVGASRSGTRGRGAAGNGNASREPYRSNADRAENNILTRAKDATLVRGYNLLAIRTRRDLGSSKGSPAAGSWVEFVFGIKD